MIKTLISILLSILLLALVGCGGQDESAEQAAESQTAITAPSMGLHTAVVMADLDVIRQHIEAGSDLNVLEPTRASTPLITAAALGKTEAAILLIDAGADLNYQNNDGSTALHTAAFFCREEIVAALLAKGADKTPRNNTGKTALEAVELPFEDVKEFYDAMQLALRPAGVVLDYDRIKAARPRITQMLK